MIKKTCLIFLCIFSIFYISACGSKESSNPSEDNVNEDSEMAREISLNEKESLTIDSLISRLLEARAIELKDINNESLGVISDKDNIVQFISRIAEYEIVDRYIEPQPQNVIGPVNIYFNDGTVIYGLMKEGYIYLDGYYFIMGRNERNYIVSLFGRSIQEIFASQ